MSLKKMVNAPPAVKGEEAEELIKNYMLQQYRPYSVTDVVLNLNNRINKVNTTKALECLAQKGELLTKVYGKSAYYVCKEIDCDTGSDSAKHLASQKDIDEYKEKSEIVAKHIEELEREYKKLLSTPSTDQLQTRIEESSIRLNQLKDQASHLSSSSESSQLADQVIQEYKAYSMILLKIYNERKKLFFNFVNTIKEGVDDYSQFMATVGIDIEDMESHKILY